MEKRIRYVLWTGGWDSTYMILTMLRAGETVQPLYIVNPRRKSRSIEMVAMEKLERMMREQVKTGEILPLKKYDLKEIPVDKEIKKALKQISRALTKEGRRPLGYQYEYLASFAKVHHAEYPVISLGVEGVSEKETGGLATAIRLFGKMTPELRVDQAVSQPALITLLGNFDFPIMKTTELEMLKNVREWGYEEIMREIWFCHKPIDGKACGFCSPCFQKSISGMDFLLTDAAKARFERFYAINQKYGRYAKLVAEFCYRILGLGSSRGKD